MTLRWKLLLAQAPLVAAMLVGAVVGGVTVSSLARRSEDILKDNFRSVLAAQRMKESIERLDSAAMFLLTGRRAAGETPATDHRRRFEQELEVQEGNITEPGEAEATRALRAHWTAYQAKYDRFVRTPRGSKRAGAYFDDLLPAFRAVKDAADVILDINQDAMLRKSDAARQSARRFRLLLVSGALGGCLLGLLVSAVFTARVLRPVSVLAQAARRIGEGDLAARARVTGSDEIAALAGEFNTMAERLQQYRESSLGELLEAQGASQATIDSLPDPVLILDVEGRLTNANRAAETLLRMKVEHGASDSLASADPAIRAVAERVHQHVISGRGTFSPKALEEAFRVLTPDGERHFLPRASPVYSETGNVTGTTLVLQDVTRLLRFDELKNNLVATVAHEFRTPLTSLRMAIHLCTEQTVGPLTDKQADLLFAAREDCERLQNIVDELLNLSRIQAGRIELRTSAVPADALVRAAVDAHRPSAVKKHVELHVEILPGIGDVQADADRVQLVFANLLANAIRHSPEGGAVVIRATPKEGMVRFEVTDEGPGVPWEYHEVIFEKYFQVPGQPSGGVGLGLFISREIVQAHGGQIGLDSDVGKGSTFWFTLRQEEPAPT